MGEGVILDDFVAMTDRGLYCRYGDFYIDASFPVATCLVSHAHGDHAVAGNGMVYCTVPTMDLMKARYGKRAAQQFGCFAYTQGFSIEGVVVYFLPAGHILGSSQIMMEYMGVKYLYTGDYKLQADTTCEAFVFEQADVLITESTFANPAIAHPDPRAEIMQFRAVEANILLGTYSLGKAQRLTRLINEMCPEKEILLHHAIAPFHYVYEKHGIKDWNYRLYSRKALKERSAGAIYMVPPLTFNSYIKAKDVVRVFASGWSRLQRGNALSLYISDHVDWSAILHTIAQVGPRQVWTLHGDGRHLKQHFEGALKVKSL